jgi:hypothetical protein
MSVPVLEIIDDALREINVISEVGTATAEQGKYALRKLNQMMDLWRETKSVDVGYFSLSATTETAQIPDWAVLTVTLSLATALASKYGASVSQELGAIANDAFNGVQTRCILDRKTGVDLSYLPVGSGHRGRGNDIRNDR